MSGRMGRRLGTVLLPPDGIALGSEPYVGIGPDGGLEILWLEYPADAALGDYVKVTGSDGVPVWMAAADLAASGGFAWDYLTAVAGDGSIVIIGDETGTPINIYHPV